MLRLTHLILALAALALPQAHAQTEALQVKRPAELRQAPSPTAPSVLTLAAQAPITRLPARQGPWIQVRTATGVTGWMHMFDVGTAAAPSDTGSTAAGALRGLSNFFNRGTAQASNSGGVTSTVGIRGLGAEDIANATPNLAAVTKIEGMRLDAAQARQFAATAPLKAIVVEALPTPEAPSAPVMPGKTGGKS